MKGETIMSKMKELYEKVAADCELQAKFAEIMKNAEAAGEEATKEKLTTFAKEAGYDVTVDEIQEYFKELTKPKAGELSDDELDQVAGGKSETGQTLIAISVLSAGLACAASSYANHENYNTWDLCTTMFE